MANRKRVYRQPIDIQNYCCCSCQNFDEDTSIEPTSHDDCGENPQTTSHPYSAHYFSEETPHKFIFSYNYDGGGSNDTSRHSSRYPTKKSSNSFRSWSKNFVFHTWLFLMISLLLINIITPVQSNSSVNFSSDERRLIRSLFLKKFGLEKLVSATQPNDTPIPEYLWELYQKVDEEGPEIVRHYYPVSSSRDSHLGMNGWLLRYNLSATNTDKGKEALIKADLRIKLDENMHEDCGTRQINVYAIEGGEPKVFRELDGKELRSSLLTRHRKWIDLDISDALIRKGDSDDDTIELFVEYVSPTTPVQLSDPQYSAALVAYFEYPDENEPVEGNNRHKRSLRHGRKHRKKHRPNRTPEAKNQCRRTPLYVDFSELNWRDWIVAPNGYDAYQCQGHCPHPLPSNLNTTNHAIIQSLIHSLDPSIVPPPSCVPTLMSSVTILYRDINNAIMMKVYPDMVVDACGCR